jgi:hypothetical protein
MILITIFGELNHPLMGHDIDIAVIAFNSDFTFSKIVKKSDHLYLSYNWGDLKHIFSIQDNMHGKIGKVVSEQLRIAIDKLKEFGVRLGIPDGNNKDWSYGIDDSGNRLSNDVRKSIFRYHLEHFLQTTDAHPTAFFISDGCSDCVYIDKDESTRIVPIVNRYRNEENDNNEAFTIYGCEKDTEDKDDERQIYYRHPVHGTMLVYTFAKAMEIYGRHRVKNDGSAETWWKVAMKMKDAPSTS